ncbi:MAG: hypothetical protein GXP15_06360 [Gammaproteobacteria bacterium]|nr:hypothetical protein [Gammaproteobacteria bacterium]
MKYYSGKRNQGGAALIVGLILLVVITVLAISGMNTATTEIAMARNDQSNENAFQAAETGLEQALAQGSFNTVTPVTLTQTINSGYDEISVDITFESSTIVPDRAFSLGVGSGIAAYHFNAISTADSKRIAAGPATDRDASAVHSQAFYKIGPESSTL